MSSKTRKSTVKLNTKKALVWAADREKEASIQDLPLDDSDEDLSSVAESVDWLPDKKRDHVTCTTKTKVRERDQPELYRKRYKLFIKTLAETGNFTYSSKVSNISATKLYSRRREDPQFAQLWERALEEANDRLELVARARAMKGAEKPIYFQGHLVGSAYEPSDRLMELLLKAAKPEKYRAHREDLGAIDINFNFNTGSTEILEQVRSDVSSTESSEAVEEAVEEAVDAEASVFSVFDTEAEED